MAKNPEFEGEARNSLRCDQKQPLRHPGCPDAATTRMMTEYDIGNAISNMEMSMSSSGAAAPALTTSFALHLQAG